MFSTSTIASSTRMPITNDSASSVITLTEKPSAYMPMKAGITDSGSATAETSVARQSRRKSHTTITARIAPSYSRCIEPSYSSATGCTKLKASVSVMSGWSAFSCASTFCTCAPTSTSLAPRLRATSKPTTGLPLSKAAARRSATVSVTVATWSSRMRWPLASESCSAPSSAADLTVASVRTGCSLPPRSARPPALSACTWRSWREMSAALAPSDWSLFASSATRTSRCTPPTRLTAPTPGTVSRRRAMVSSTNHDRPSSSSWVDCTVYASTGVPARSTLVMIGSRRSAGMSARTRLTAERTSSTASCTGFSSRNSARMVTVPSCTVVVMCFKPCRVAIEFSILRATSVSSCPGAAPGSRAVTLTSGRSMSGKFCTFIALKDSMPAKVSSTNSITAGIGFLIDQDETFMAGLRRGVGSGSASSAPYFVAEGRGASTAADVFGSDSCTTLTRSRSFRKPAPCTTTGVSAARPAVISSRSPTRRPVCTLRCDTRWSWSTAKT